MYEQSLVRVIKDHIKPKVLKRNNRYKKWEYGYDVENDVVVISKDGTIGDVIEVQNLKIALPAIPDNVYAVSDKIDDQRWAKSEYPKPLAKIKSVFDWERYPVNVKDRNDRNIRSPIIIKLHHFIICRIVNMIISHLIENICKCSRTSP